MGDFFSTYSPIHVVSNDKTPSNNAAETLYQLKSTQETINKRIEFLSLKIAEQTRLARTENDRGNKSRALMCVRRKRMFENSIDKLRGIHFNIETQADAIENMHLSASCVDALKDSNALLKSMQTTMNVDDVHETMEDVEEHGKTMNEIVTALSNDYTNLDFDEDQLEDELRNLVMDDAVTSLRELDVPSNALTTAQFPRIERQEHVRSNTTADTTKSLEAFGDAFF